MKRMFLVCVLVGLLLSGCVVGLQSKTVWDNQGCAYTLSHRSNDPMVNPDEWLDASMHFTTLSRAADQDRPTCHHSPAAP